MGTITFKISILNTNGAPNLYEATMTLFFSISKIPNLPNPDLMLKLELSKYIA